MICASPACRAFAISWPVLSTFSFTSTPCLRKMPFSTPTKLGTWLTLAPTAATSTAGAWAAADHASPATRAAMPSRPVSRLIVDPLLCAARCSPGARLPELPRGDPRALGEAGHLRPHDAGIDRRLAHPGAEAAVGADHDVVAPHQPRVAADALGHQLRVLDVVRLRFD